MFLVLVPAAEAGVPAEPARRPRQRRGAWQELAEETLEAVPASVDDFRGKSVQPSVARSAALVLARLAEDMDGTQWLPEGIPQQGPGG